MDRVIFDLLMRGFTIALRPFTEDWHALQDRFRGIGKSDWPTAHGVVFTWCVGQSERRVWVAELSYSYNAAGEYWSGEMRRHFALEKDADYYASQHPKGSPVVVRYNPAHPEQSVALSEDQRLASAAGTI